MPVLTMLLPYRNKCSRANGLLKQGKTTIAQITDGSSNTIMFAEMPVVIQLNRALTPEGYDDRVNLRVIGTNYVLRDWDWRAV